jgi:hypothetical protein
VRGLLPSHRRALNRGRSTPRPQVPLGKMRG